MLWLRTNNSGYENISWTHNETYFDDVDNSTTDALLVAGLSIIFILLLILAIAVYNEIRETSKNKQAQQNRLKEEDDVFNEFVFQSTDQESSLSPKSLEQAERDRKLYQFDLLQPWQCNIYQERIRSNTTPTTPAKGRAPHQPKGQNRAHPEANCPTTGNSTKLPKAPNEAREMAKKVASDPKMILQKKD
ncbi:hypothetical protein RB195_018356 [Necator americanus]|uniref:Uncharacterized protein n=1 Tax=Necator americanus TaxID=51031 RepID=A0ABR1CAG9_NECAM